MSKKEYKPLEGLVEGVDYRLHKGYRIPLRKNVDRDCASCKQYKPAKSFYSSLHADCRKCIRDADGPGRPVSRTASGNPNRRQTKREKGTLKKLREQAMVLARQTVVNQGVTPDVPDALRPYYEKALQQIAKRQAEVKVSQALPAASAVVAKSHFDKELAARTLARRRLIHYVLRFNPNYLAGWVHKDIARRLERFVQQVKEGKSPRLLLLVPPRHGKSKLASEELVSWVFGHYPDWEVISTSYNVGLPLAFSRRIRDRMRDPNYAVLFPETKLHEESQAVEEWSTTAGGGYRAAGVGGGITGKGAKILIVDDPVKNWEEADSPVVRDSTWDWYLSTARSRLAPGGGVLGIQTWWNDDDWAGRIQQAMATGDGEQFEIVKYPAINEGYDEYLDADGVQILQVPPGSEPPDDATLLRPEGTALHPERYTLAELIQMKKNYSALGQRRMWSALYQQNPIPEEGIQFTRDMFSYVDELPVTIGMDVYCAWDFAITEKQTSDWTVGYALAKDWHGNLWELEVVRFKSEDNKIIADAIIDLYERHKCTLCGVENGQIWKGIKSTVLDRAKERLPHFNFEELNTLTDKKVRASPLRGTMQLHRLKMKKDQPWREIADTEFLRFPAGKHDDIVDAAAWAVRTALNHASPSNPSELAKARMKQPASWKDRVAGLLRNKGGGHMSS